MEHLGKGLTGLDSRLLSRAYFLFLLLTSQSHFNIIGNCLKAFSMEIILNYTVFNADFFSPALSNPFLT